MRLTIITINRDNEAGLRKTIESVLSQSCMDFEYVIVDGASKDESVEVIQQYARHFGDRMKWISEPDTGIYNAMNKGIRLATGEYVEFLNSGDCLASEDVVAKMFVALDQCGFPSILYGNMLKNMPEGFKLKDRGFAGREITLLSFYSGTLNHSPAFIRRTLFDKYGMYDEELKIVSEWKWVMQVIIIGKERPNYVDLDVTLFDMHGISETNKELCQKERQAVLTSLFPSTVLEDYKRWSFPIRQMQRLKRHLWAYSLVWFIERCLFKGEQFVQRQKREITFDSL